MVVGRVSGAARFCRLFFFVFLFGSVRLFLCCAVCSGVRLLFCTLLSHHFGGSFSYMHIFFYLSKKKKFNRKKGIVIGTFAGRKGTP